MKLIIGVIVSLMILDLFQCTPIIGSEDGSIKVTNTSSSWGFNAGVNAGLGLEGGYKDGHAVLGINKHLGANIGGHRENSQTDTVQKFPSIPVPNNYGQGLSSPYYPGNNLPYYYNPYYQQFPPQAGQQLVYGPLPQPMQQYPQWSQFGPQYPQPYGPQFAQPPVGPQFAQSPVGPQFPQPPFGPQFPQPPVGPQFAQQPAGSQSYQILAGPASAQQPTGSEYDQQPTAYIQQWPQYTQQSLLPTASIPQKGGPTKSP
ncbi:hypothetical protein PYW08_005541 [Mythimna loreyi]|uniref:Uncharacterized protein n=1 Tax=Mythimna loreyi TaxID=667449 RepID=A0ACC2QHY0_9NEOP|nr:hypothetical protein PYW08_005541 [Mythimna loreyi]